jgi:hypothetical protein
MIVQAAAPPFDDVDQTTQRFSGVAAPCAGQPGAPQTTWNALKAHIAAG